MTQPGESDIVYLYVVDSLRGTRELVRAMDLAGAPLGVNPGYKVIFRDDQIRGADAVEIEFGRKE
jgi:hypothetical protein